MSNKLTSKQNKQSKLKAPRTIALGYLIVGTVWILLSDRFLTMLAPTVEKLARWQTLKGWGYVIVTTILLYGVIRIYAARWHQVEEALRGSEQQFKLFMQYLPGAVFIKDREGVLQFCNQRFADTAGSSPAEIIGKKTTEYMPPEEREKHGFEQENTQVLAENHPMVFEHTYPGPEGPTHWLTYKFPIPTEEGSSFLGSMSLEITERKQMQEQLKEREERLQALVQNALNAILVIDDNGDFIMTNPAAAELFDIPLEELEQGSIFDIHRPDHVDSEDLFQRYLKKGQESGEISFLTPDGRKRIAEYHTVQVREDFNLSILNDITERKQAEKSLQAHRDHLEEEVAERTKELRILVDAMTGREVRMAELKETIRQLRRQLKRAGLEPIADDPLLEEDHA